MCDLKTFIFLAMFTVVTGMGVERRLSGHEQMRHHEQMWRHDRGLEDAKRQNLAPPVIFFPPEGRPKETACEPCIWA